MGKDTHSRNDQRSDVKNPNNPAYQDDVDNKSRQLNPQDEVYEESHQKGKVSSQKRRNDNEDDD